MVRVLSRLREIAPLETAVLIVGEPGAGKDLIAAVLHQNSPRRNAPFVKLDCTALSGRWLARELFGAPGHGSQPRHPGRLELAAEGTLYLDEVGGLSREQQVRLAETLRARQLRGGLEGPPVEINVRLVASAPHDLEATVEEGRFHEGLYAQLCATRIDLPPLRHRRRDIPRLARHFLAEHARLHGRAVTLGRDALDRLQRYDWPGNVAELRTVVESLAEELPERAILRAKDLPEEIRTRPAQEGVVISRGTPLREAERLLILDAMRTAGENREKAARLLGIGVRTLYRKLKANRTGPPPEPRTGTRPSRRSNRS
jgi:two-component system response regulator HydG